MSQLVGTCVHPHNRGLACVNAYASHFVWLCHNCIMPLTAIGRILNLVTNLILTINCIFTLGDKVISHTLHILQQLIVGHIFRKPQVLSIAVIALAIRIFNAAHNARHFEIVTTMAASFPC